MTRSEEIKEVYRSWSQQHTIPPFYQPEWLDLLCGKAGWQVAMARDEKDEVVAFWLVAMHRKYSLQLLLSPPLSVYMGPYPVKAGSTKYYQTLVNQLPSYAFLEQKMHLSVENPSALQNLGFHVAATPTHLLGLDPSEEELFKNFKSSLRRQIRKGLKHLKTAEKPHKKVSHLITSRMQSVLGEQMPPEQTFAQLLELIEDKNWGKVFSLKKEGELVGSLVVIHNGKDAIYLISAQTETGKRYGASSLLMWQAIQWAKQEGHERFDFEGSTVPGIARFFKSFGAYEQPVYNLRHVKHPLLKLYFRLKGH